MKRVLIVGCGGQDGRILAERLRREGAAVFGVDLDRVEGPAGAGLPANVDVRSDKDVRALVSAARPDELYYLAAYHHSSEDVAPDPALLLRKSWEVNVLGLSNALEAVRRDAPACRLFYAASSHVFGHPERSPQDETTPLEPRNVYGVTKTAGLHMCRLYRRDHSVFAAAGILYNHESRHRARGFVSTRIVHGAIEAAAKREERTHWLRLGNLEAVVDWGFAPDYVDAMLRVLALPGPDDFVIATGEPHTVRDFAEVAFRAVGLDWREHVEEDPSLLHKQTVTLVGDSKKLRARTGWVPSVGFEDMVRQLVGEAT